MTYTVESLPAVLAAVDGEPSGSTPCGVCGGSIMHDEGTHKWESVIGPPLSWEGIDLTCQHCNGEPVEIDLTYDENGNVDGSNYMKCPDCVNGHPIIEVWACGADPTIRVEPPPVRCEQCYPVRVSIQAVPIVALDEHSHPAPPFIGVDIFEVAVAIELPWPAKPDAIVTLPAGARPGQWAIVATEVDR